MGQIDELLIELDRIARDINGFAFGLPLSEEEHKKELRSAVIRWLLKDA